RAARSGGRSSGVTVPRHPARRPLALFRSAGGFQPLDRRVPRRSLSLVVRNRRNTFRLGAHVEGAAPRRRGLAERGPPWLKGTPLRERSQPSAPKNRIISLLVRSGSSWSSQCPASGNSTSVTSVQ